MDLHNIVFPSPSNKYNPSDYENELIFIPVDEDKTLTSKKRSIPGLFLKSDFGKISKGVMIYFHGNAEDIFIARDLCDKLRDVLHV